MCSLLPGSGIPDTLPPSFLIFQVGNVLQFPCELSPKWTTLCIDLVEILQRCKKSGFKCLKAVQVPALHIRQVVQFMVFALTLCYLPGVSLVLYGATLFALARSD